jgi:hypothetical protein
MWRTGTKPWGSLAASLIISLKLAPAAQAQNTSGAAGSASGSETSVTLPEVSVSAQPDRAFFAPDTASQGVVTGKEIEEQPRSRVGEVLEIARLRSARLSAGPFATAVEQNLPTPPVEPVY